MGRINARRKIWYERIGAYGRRGGLEQRRRGSSNHADHPRATARNRPAARGYGDDRRATVPALEEILYEALPVLDHGFVRVVDYMGDDGAVVQAARVSYGRGTKKVSEDRALISYLMRHRHSTPFEMCEIKFHVKLRSSSPGNGFATAPPM